VRSNNEDSVYAGPRLLALADGMGGHAAGEVASQLVIEALAHLDDDEPGDDLLNKLDNAMRVGNAAIADQVEEEPELDGMGTTLTAILFAGRKLGLIHIGDSRAYLMRDGELTQITRDDTFVQSLVDEGRITAEQAHTHPQRSLIMRALTGNEIDPTLTMREARAGDRYLLCSDGLSDVVTDETLANALGEGGPDECGDRLIELALRGGGPDNVTVVVADVIDVDYGQSHPIVAGALSDEEDAPRPNTAAGRAAAMRPPQAAPRRPAAPPQPLARKRNPAVWIVGAVVLIAVLMVGVYVGYRLIRSNYYVSADNGHVAVFRGLPGTFLGMSVHEVDQLACADGNLVAPAEQGSCTPLEQRDLRQDLREKVSAGLPSGSRDEARKQVQELAKGLMAPCAEPQSGPITTSAEPPRPAGPGQPALPPPGPAQPAPPPAPVTTVPTVTVSPKPQVPGQDCRAAR
jgi:protein phosphatase